MPRAIMVDALPRQMNCSRLARRQRGLTLIELCIAVALLALITTMSYRALDSMGRTSERTLAEGERWQAIAACFERLASDVAQPSRRPLRAGMDSGTAQAEAAPVLGAPGAAAPLPPFWGRVLPTSDSAASFDAQLEFTRKSPSGRDDVRLGYRLRETRLELLIWPVLDRAPTTTPEVFTLLDGVASLRLRYLDTAGTWRDSWPIEGNSIEPLPRAVEVELTMSDGLLLHRVFALPS